MGDIWDAIVKFWREGTAQNPLLVLLLNILQALLAVIVLVIAGRIAKRYIFKLINRASRNPNLGALTGNFVYVGFIILAILAVLTIFTGAGFQSLFTLFGIVSLAVSLSLQDILKNVVAGTYLLLEQPFKIGDVIKVRDVEGQVMSIDIRTTKIKTEGSFQVVVPNGIIFTEIVTNHTAYNRRAVIVRLTLPVEANWSEANEKIQEVLKGFGEEDLSPSPAPGIWLDSTAEGKATARIEFWTPHLYQRQTGSKVAMALRDAIPGSEVTSIT